MRAAPTKNLAIPARRVMWAVLALTAALALSACGEKKEPLTGGGPGQKVDLDLDFYVNADHAGIYTAIDRGFFKAAGLNVDPHVPTDPAGPIKQVAAGRADFAISYEPEVLLARAQGLPVTAVAAVVNQPLTSLISLPTAGINTPADLAGKKVATAGIPYQEDYLDSILNAANVDPDKVGVTNVGLNLLPALLGGQADAILGGFSNIEGVDLQMRGASPHIQPVSQLGVPTYDELVLVANSDDVKKDSDEIRLFINALALGTKYAAANPKVATASVLKAGSGLDPTVTAKEVATTLPLLYPPPAAKKPEPYGYMDPTEWETFAGFMVGAGAMDQVPSIGDALTDDLLPPTG